jgi:hypothetical protein
MHKNKDGRLIPEVVHLFEQPGATSSLLPRLIPGSGKPIQETVTTRSIFIFATAQSTA